MDDKDAAIIVKLLSDAEKALTKLADEAGQCVEFDDWPELRRCVEKARVVAYKIRKVA